MALRLFFSTFAELAIKRRGWTSIYVRKVAAAVTEGPNRQRPFIFPRNINILLSDMHDDSVDIFYHFFIITFDVDKVFDYIRCAK